MFNGGLLSPIQPQNEPMEMSVTNSSDSNDPMKESRITRRSIRVPTTNTNGIRARSRSIENKHQPHPALSSSEESLSDKNK